MEELEIIILWALSWIFVCTMQITLNNKNRDKVNLTNNDKILYGFSIFIFVIANIINFIFFMELVQDNRSHGSHGLKIAAIIILGYILSIWLSVSLLYKPNNK